jgi:hypothetical protein
VRAIVRETYGPPEVLHLEEIPLPNVGDGDVLVRVQAASANAGDWHLLRGTPLPFRLVAGLRKPKFKIMVTISPGASKQLAATSPSSVRATTCSENSPGAASVRTRNSRLRRRRRWR